MSKHFWGVIVLITLAFAGIIFFTNDKSAAPGKDGSGSKTLTQNTIGKGTTGVTLLEYGDFECPYCGQYYPILKQVKAEFGDQIKFQFRHYPLTGPHPNAFAASRAAEAASLQGKFWEMHDLLYENQQQWSRAGDAVPVFYQYAKSLGLDEARFKKDFASSRVNDLVNADFAEGTRLGVTGTPTFYLDGKQVKIGQSLAEFQKVIKAAIAKKAPAGSPTPATTPAPATDPAAPAPAPQTPAP